MNAHTTGLETTAPQSIGESVAAFYGKPLLDHPDRYVPEHVRMFMNAVRYCIDATIDEGDPLHIARVSHWSTSYNANPPLSDLAGFNRIPYDAFPWDTSVEITRAPGGQYIAKATYPHTVGEAEWEDVTEQIWPPVAEPERHQRSVFSLPAYKAIFGRLFRQTRAEA